MLARVPASKGDTGWPHAGHQRVDRLSARHGLSLKLKLNDFAARQVAEAD